MANISGKLALPLALALGLSAGSALAGECPADQVMVGALNSGETAPKGVTDELLSSIDLSSKGEAWKGNMFRLRRLVVEAGGVVPWHSHEARIANILVIEGAITEYASNCKVPIVHKAGEAAPESIGLSHWWKNNTKKRAVLISADILPPEMHHDDTM
jgi:quercetin dioxygenase-like cupin family protein